MDVVLDSETPSHSIEWSDGSSVHLDHNDLDLTVGALAGNQPGLEVSDVLHRPWDSQLVLQGSQGNDSFVGERAELEQEQTVIHFQATDGSDRIKAAPIWNGWTMAS